MASIQESRVGAGSFSNPLSSANKPERHSLNKEITSFVARVDRFSSKIARLEEKYTTKDADYLQKKVSNLDKKAIKIDMKEIKILRHILEQLSSAKFSAPSPELRMELDRARATLSGLKPKIDEIKKIMLPE